MPFAERDGLTCRGYARMGAQAEQDIEIPTFSIGKDCTEQDSVVAFSGGLGSRAPHAGGPPGPGADDHLGEEDDRPGGVVANCIESHPAQHQIALCPGREGEWDTPEMCSHGDPAPPAGGKPPAGNNPPAGVQSAVVQRPPGREQALQAAELRGLLRRWPVPGRGQECVGGGSDQ